MRSFSKGLQPYTAAARFVIAFLLTTCGPCLGAPGDTDLHYFKVETPVDLIMSISEKICTGLAAGYIDRQLKVVCDAKSCSGQYKSEISYFDVGVYLTPTFSVEFLGSDPAKSSAEQRTTVPFNWGSDSSVQVHISQNPSGTTKELVTSAAECFQKVGSVLSDKIHPYDSGSMLATLPTEQTADFERSVYKLDNIDVAFLYVSLPRHLRADDEFPVEVTLILPQRMGPGSTPSISSEVEEGQKRLAAATGNKDAMQVGYDAAEYDLQKIPFVGFESPFKTGALKLAGGEFVVTSLAPETQTLKPLHAAFWSWTLKGKSPGDAFIYFSVSATDRDGTVLTRVIPMKLHLSRNWISSVGDFAASHVEWIVGTAVIPVLAFLWGLWIKRRSNAKSS